MLTKLISLTQGRSAIVDDDDYDYLMQWEWYAHLNGKTFYAQRLFNWRLNGNKRGRLLKMHRELIGVRGLEVDHINGNGLDNRRENLRLATRSQNAMNSQGRRGTSIHKGVSWNKRDRVWESKITIGGKMIHLGCFKIEQEAALAYDARAKEIFGEFAYLNFAEGYTRSKPSSLQEVR